VIHATLGPRWRATNGCAPSLLGFATRPSTRRLEERRKEHPLSSAEEAPEGTTAENKRGEERSQSRSPHRDAQVQELYLQLPAIPSKC